jgi:hypothetical protein
MVGTVMSGKFSLGKELYAIIPANEINIVIKYTVILLSMAQLEGLNSLILSNI